MRSLLPHPPTHPSPLDPRPSPSLRSLQNFSLHHSMSIEDMAVVLLEAGQALTHVASLGVVHGALCTSLHHSAACTL